ncbi:SBBP repeat-containing protein [Methanothrix sp.]|uniref:SBBP repeat-containing protein n=1 Tax=Methanothrix sp. TaxID=90426 RepID=UPI003298AFF2
MVRIKGPTVFFTPSEVVFSLFRGNNSSAVHMAFENSSPGQIIGEEQLPGRANFFIGNDSTQWISDIPTFGSIRYKEIYPGVDLVFKGTEGYLKHELALNPGADLSGIILTYSGQDNLSLAEDGSLLIRTSAGNLTDSVPVCYQEINGSREMVEGRYRLVGDNGVGFEIVDYDRRYRLVIDPALAYSTYLGGSSDDSGLSLALDSSGNAYVTGYTASTNYPTKDPLQASNAGSNDVFVAKINSAGSALSYSTYLGGGGYDYAKGIAVDSSGNAYVTGYTASTNFPTKNPLQASNAGSNDAFIAKINSAGSALSYSTYLGGSGEDNGERIAVDGSGNAYVTGYTGSTSFPTKNPIQASKAGLWDAFVSKINSAGSALVYSTYLGGGSSEYGLGIALDGSSNAYITGPTYSTNFPTTNPLQASNGGEMDAFVSKINSAGSALTYSTYLGGSFNDFAEGIAVDSRGNAYVTGYTISNDFPTQNPIQALKDGSFDAFVTKINSAGSGLAYSTYLGGSGDCFAHGIAVDGWGNAIVTGDTSSADFPTRNPLQASNGGSHDIFVTMINAAGSALSFSTYLGGVNYDYAKGIAIDDFGKTYLTGYTESNNFPTQNPLQPANAGYKDAFVAAIDFSDLPNNPPNTPSVPLGENSGFAEVDYTYFTSASDPDGDQVKYTFDWGDGSTASTDFVDSGATASMSHSWTNAGVYQIKAMATDSRGATSGWSEAAAVQIIEREEWILYYPDFTDTAYPDSWRSWLMLQNPSDKAATIQLELRDRTGGLRYSGSLTIPANGVAAIRPRDLAGIDFAGSAVVTSDRPIAGTCEINRNSNTMCMSYKAIDHGSNQLFYPDFTDTANPNGWRSLFVLQNPDGFPSNLNIEIRSRAGDLLYQGAATIPANGVITIRPMNLAGFDTAGSASIVSDRPIMGTCQINRNNNEMCMIYKATEWRHLFL